MLRRPLPPRAFPGPVVPARRHWGRPVWGRRRYPIYRRPGLLDLVLGTAYPTYPWVDPYYAY